MEVIALLSQHNTHTWGTSDEHQSVLRAVTLRRPYVPYSTQTLFLVETRFYVVNLKLSLNLSKFSYLNRCLFPGPHGCWRVSQLNAPLCCTPTRLLYFFIIVTSIQTSAPKRRMVFMVNITCLFYGLLTFPIYLQVDVTTLSSFWQTISIFTRASWPSMLDPDREGGNLPWSLMQARVDVGSCK